MLFPALSEKPTCYHPLQVVGQSYGYFTFILQLPPAPTVLVFLSFSSMHSKDFLLFQTWTSLLLLLEDLYTTLIPNRFLFIYAGLDLGLVHAAFERELFFDYFFCPVSPWASFRHKTSGQIFHMKYLGYIFNPIPLFPGPIIEWTSRKNRCSVAEWKKCALLYSNAALLSN